jgi:hypothetical protein
VVKTQNQEFCIKAETCDHFYNYFLYGFFLCFLVYIQWISLQNYFNNFVFVNGLFCLIGIISIVQIVKMQNSTIQQFSNPLFIVGLIYGITNIILYFFNHLNWIAQLGLGFPYLQTTMLFIVTVDTLLSTITNFFRLKAIDKLKNQDISGNRRGIIVVLLDNPALNFTTVGIELLIEKSRLRNELYSIYFCYSNEEIKKIFFNPEIDKIWIFGHGVFHGVKTDEGIFYYCDLEQCPTKEEIAQMHCGRFGGKSAADYLIRPFDAKKCIAKKGLRNVFLENEKDIEEFFKNKRGS